MNVNLLGDGKTWIDNLMTIWKPVTAKRISQELYYSFTDVKSIVIMALAISKPM
jgi:hypothetical protein